MKCVLTILLIMHSILGINYSLLIGQDTVHYIGTTRSNVDYHHGQLSPAIGVHNIQTMRANRGDNNNITS